MLVDAGGGNRVFGQLGKMTIDINDLEYGFLTHCHTDHLLGFVWVMRIVMYGYMKEERNKPFTLFASRVCLDALERICRLTLGDKLWDKVVGDKVFLKEVVDGQHEKICGLDVEFFDTRCIEKDFPQMGFFIKEKGFVFAGDVPISEELYQKFSNQNTLCLEAFCTEDRRNENLIPLQKHKTVLESAVVAQRLGAKKLILWHGDDDKVGDRKERYLKEARSVFSGEIFAPDDLEIIEGL